MGALERELSQSDFVWELLSQVTDRPAYAIIGELYNY